MTETIKEALITLKKEEEEQLTLAQSREDSLLIKQNAKNAQRFLVNTYRKHSEYAFSSQDFITMKGAFQDAIKKETSCSEARDMALTAVIPVSTLNDNNIQKSVNKFIARYGLSAALKTDLTALRRQKQQELEQSNSAKDSLFIKEKYKYKEIMSIAKRQELSHEILEAYSKNKMGLLQYDKQLKLSLQQKKEWINYYATTINNTKSDSELKQAKLYLNGIGKSISNEFSGSLPQDQQRTAQCKNILTQEQYNKLITIIAKPRAKSKSKAYIKKLNKKGIDITEEDKTLIFKYLLTQAKIQARYCEDEEKKKELLRLSKQQGPKRIMELNTALKRKEGNKKTGQPYRGTYRW